MRFKKIMSVLASAVMLSSTIGFAAAASYPEPFVSGGTADGAVVYGANAALTDVSAAIDLQENLQALVTSGDGSGTIVSGTAWQVGTSSDILEIGEPITSVANYIDDTDLPILTDGTIMNEKGTADYEQYFYFNETGSEMVNYTTDSSGSDDVVGLFFYIASGDVIARYVMSFTTPLKSDITTASVYEDIEDEEISILGKTYTITKAVNSSAGTLNSDLTLMSGADKVTVSNDEEVTAGGKTISVIVSASNAAQFTIDGETTTKLAEGDTYQLSDGTYLGISDITYQNFAGGLMQATVYVGADKLFLDDDGSLQVNAETISDAHVHVEETFSSNDVSITEIEIWMTAEDDLYVPIDGKLSEASDLDEPQVLISQNWDIEFKGLETYDLEEFKLNPSGSDRDYILTFNDFDGTSIQLPLLYTNDSGIFGGEKEGRDLILSPNGTQAYGTSGYVQRNDYFILNTADPKTASNNAKSYVIQYKGSDKVSDDSAKATFEVLGAGDQDMNINSTGGFNIRLGGSTFYFANVSNGESDNFNIQLLGPDYSGATISGNSSVSAYLRTENNALINITDVNGSSTHSASIDSSNWIVTLSIDDTNRDDDSTPLTTAQVPLTVTFGNATAADATASVTIQGAEVTDPDNSDMVKMQTQYGVYIESEDPSGAPATITATIPESVVNPLVYVTSGDVVITPGSSGGAGGQVIVVKDSEVASVASKNLIVVGGSCINTVAAKILGSTSPLCTDAFTTATGVGAGQYIIKTVMASEAVTGGSEDKVAMLVAGYNAADTTTAVAKAMEGVDATAGTEQVYPMTSA